MAVMAVCWAAAVASVVQGWRLLQAARIEHDAQELERLMRGTDGYDG